MSYQSIPISVLFSLLLCFFGAKAESNTPFKVDLKASQDQLFLTFEIAPDHYLYQDKLAITAKGAQIKIPALPLGETYNDPLFGITKVYTQKLEIPINIRFTTEKANLSVQYQGCTKGFCYPPLTKNFTIDASTNYKSFTLLQNDLWMLLVYFGLGLSVAFTPCLYPMYPILLGSLAHNQQKAGSGFKYAFWYVQGMAITYSMLGLTVASLGLSLHNYLQHPFVLTTLSLLFIIMGGFMLGWFQFSFPVTWNAKLSDISAKFAKKGSLGAFMIGALTGFICSPCTTAPLSAALLYIGQTGNQLLGASALYTMSLGMGLPLLMMGLGYQKLPLSGPWLEKIQRLLGLVFLAIPVMLLSRFLADHWIKLLILILCGYFFFLCWRYLAHHSTNKKQRLSWGALFLTLWFTLGLTQTIPWQRHQSDINNVFITIDHTNDLNHYFQQAQQNSQHIILEFTADWCSACKIMEQQTFSNAQVRDHLTKFINLRLDITHNIKNFEEVLKKYEVHGIPTILVLSPNPPEIVERIVGLKSSIELLNILKELPLYPVTAKK